MEKLPQEIIDGLPDHLRAEYMVCYNAVVVTLRAYKDAPTSASKNNWQAAREALAEVEQRVAERQDGTSGGMNWPESFSTQQQVLAYLVARGYKVGKSSLSKHVRARLLKKRQDGFHRKDVDRYAELQLRDASGLDAGGKKNAELLERKLKADIAKTEEQAKKAKLEREAYEGKLIERELVEQELAGRAVALEAGFDHMVYTLAAEWIDLVDGSQARADRLIIAMMEAKQAWLNTYASTAEFVVVLSK